MTTPPSSRCPFHADAAPPAPVLHPPGTWPPGPPVALTGWSLLRHMSHDLLGAMQGWRQAHGDLVHLRMWPEHQIVVTDPHLVRELLVTHHDALVRWERGIRVFAQTQGYGVMIAEGRDWSAKRQALQPAFAPRSVQAFVATIATAAGRALDDWPADGPSMPVDSALTALAMDVIMRMMFSSEIGTDARAAEQAVHDVLAIGNAEMFWPASWPDWMPWKRRKRAALATLRSLIGRQVAARLALPRDAWPQDLLSRLLALHHADGAAWPLSAVRDECMTAFLAGHETTAASLLWWAWCMASHPEAQERARREVQSVLQGRAPEQQDIRALPYLAQTLNEALRLYPAAPVLMSRRSLKPVELGGWTIPARTMFMLPISLIQRDPSWFPEPDAFRPERFAEGAAPIPRGAFMPFGTGPRVCLGQHLAQTEMTVVASMILQRFALSVPAGEAAPQPVLNISLRPAQPLHLKVERLRPGA